MSGAAGWGAEPWGPAAFERARRESKPVLLVLSDPHGVGADFARAVGGFVLVRARAEERPDVYERYAALAPQSLLVLNAAGDVLASPQWGEEAGLVRELARVSGSYDPKPAPAAADDAPVWTGAVGAPKTGTLDEARPAALVAEIKGMGKIYNADALFLLLQAAGEWGDEEARARLTSQLEELVPAKPQGLGPRADWLRLFAEAAAVSGSEALKAAARARAAELLSLREGDALRWEEPGSQVYSGANASAALALLRAGAVLGELSYREAAEKILVHLERQLYDPLLGITHRRPAQGEPMVYGLLEDNALCALAYSEAYFATGRKVYREFADTLVRFMFQELWDRDGGGFVDRIPQKDDAGLLKQPRRPARANAAALEVLWRLHHAKGNTNYKRWLEWGLKSLLAEHEGAGAAALARVQDIHRRGRMDLELVGRPGEAAADAFLAELRRHYAPRAIVSFVDPDDQDYILAHKFAVKGDPQVFPKLFGCVDLRPVASAASPADVGAVIAALRAPAQPVQKG